MYIPENYICGTKIEFHMHTPTKQQWQTVIDNLKSILPLSEREGCGLNMMEAQVNDRDYPCGTIHCVGGWYAIACKLHETSIINYEHGANLMANHLGFESDVDLEIWAARNVRIWGNDKGGGMFSSRTAYAPMDKFAMNHVKGIPDIIAWLEGVRDRSPE